ncbi:MAG: hypothetical protein IJS57_03110 [Paludibacteraceae bacterium]|nr:hypothetical protein [Paludibacteraceae bacterium]
MKKIILLVSAFAAVLCNAQGFSIQTMMRSSSQQLIEEAVQGGLYVVESSYVLEDTLGQRFGLDGNPYFNRLSYAGFALKGGVIIPTATFSPWGEDPSFEPYQNNYRPILYGVTIRMMKDTVAHSIESLAFKDTISLCEGFIAARKNDIVGFETDTTSGEKDGWFILIEKEKNTILSIHKSISISSNETQRVNLPYNISDVLGGIYVVPQVEKVGHVAFQICGIVLPSEAGKQLTLLPAFLGNNYAKQLAPSLKSSKLQPIVAQSEKQKTSKKSPKKIK